MSEEIKEEFPIVTTFGEIEIGNLFSYLDELYIKASRIRGIRQSDSLDWIFPVDCEINT